MAVLDILLRLAVDTLVRPGRGTADFEGPLQRMVMRVAVMVAVIVMAVLALTSVVAGVLMWLVPVNLPLFMVLLGITLFAVAAVTWFAFQEVSEAMDDNHKPRPSHPSRDSWGETLADLGNAFSRGWSSR